MGAITRMTKRFLTVFSECRPRGLKEGPNWNSVELKVKFLTEKLRVKII